MPVPTRHGSRRALAEVYADLAPAVRRRIRRLARARRMDADSAEQDVDTVFVAAYADHDPARGDFSRRFAFLAHARFGDQIRKRRESRKYLTRLGAHDVADAVVPEPFRAGYLGRDLTADGRLLLALIFDEPEESGHDLWAYGRRLPFDVPVPDVLRSYLRTQLWWNSTRISRAFTAVRNAI